MERSKHDSQYNCLHDALEAKYFKLVSRGKPQQHRVLRARKSLDAFNQRHAQLWTDHEDSLIADGHMEPRPTRGQPTELGIIRQRLDALEAAQ